MSVQRARQRATSARHVSASVSAPCQRAKSARHVSASCQRATPLINALAQGQRTPSPAPLTPCVPIAPATTGSLSENGLDGTTKTNLKEAVSAKTGFTLNL